MADNAEEKEYIVPMRFTQQGVEIYVTAKNPKEAAEKARAGQWDEIDTEVAEIISWEIIGEPVENN